MPDHDPQKSAIYNSIKKIEDLYPSKQKWNIALNRRRLAWQVSAVLKYCQDRDSPICDLGGGLSPQSAILADLGYKTVVYDDFGDSNYFNEDISNIINIFTNLGVSVYQDNLSDFTWPFNKETISVVTSFYSMEHWSFSPKSLFSNVFKSIVPGGSFILGVPNCVNLRKRLTMPFGYGKWTSMNEWYENEPFRGHVREPDVGDLVYIARSMGFKSYKIVGRNWLGYKSRLPLVKQVTPIIDFSLRPFPSLCSDIILIAEKT